MNLKCRDEGEKVRLTWNWPVDTEEVYIFTGEESGGDESGGEGFGEDSGGRLYTLQEYKKRGGLFLPKMPGVTVYRVGGESVSFTCRTVIRFSISEKIGLPVFAQNYRNFEITLTAEHDVAADSFCYVKKENGFPAHSQDGIIYCFSEPLEAGRGVTRIVRTEKNEYIRLFADEELYILKE